MDIIESDILIIGSGIAGLRAALEISRKGKKALIVSKAPLGKANNTYLSGGFLAFASDNEGMDAQVLKTIRGGKDLNNRALVDKFVKEAPAMIKEFREIGVKGTIQSGGLALRNTMLVGGPEITPILLKACCDANVSMMDGVMLTDLIIENRCCLGAIGYDKRLGKILAFRTGAVLLAAGGAGAIYAINDNAPGITGDGYVLGMQAGLELIDMEFVQFYPLVYAGAGQARMILPSLFADLGMIKNRQGEDLKKKYGLNEKPVALVSRDRLSQALFREITLGNGIEGTILLDMRGISEDRIPFSDHSKKLFKKRFCYDSEPMKITPACHHTMGGVIIDETCRTSIKGLYAAGEVVGGIHGANRIGGNALTEALVFGALSARSAIDDTDSNKPLSGFRALAKEIVHSKFELMTPGYAKPSVTKSLMALLKKILWEKVGIIRRGESLKEAIKNIDGILAEIGDQAASKPKDFCKLLECKNAALTGRAIAVSALARNESRGSHYREDFPEESGDWIKHIHIQMGRNFPEISRTTSAKN